MCLNRFPLPPEASPQTQRTKSQEKKHTCSPTACVCKARFHVVSGAWIIRKYISIMEEYLQMSIISWEVNFFLFSLKSPPHSNNFHFALQWDIIVAQADEWYSELFPEVFLERACVQHSWCQKVQTTNPDSLHMLEGQTVAANAKRETPLVIASIYDSSFWKSHFRVLFWEEFRIKR